MTEHPTRPLRFGVVAPMTGDVGAWRDEVRRIADLGYSTLLAADVPGWQPVPAVSLAVRGPRTRAVTAEFADTVNFAQTPLEDRRVVMEPAAEVILRRREEGGFSYVVGANAVEALVPAVASWLVADPLSESYRGAMSVEIRQSDLRNDNAAVMRRVAAGESFVVTVNGRPVADVVPHRRHTGRRRFVPVGELAQAFAADPVPDPAAWRADLRSAEGDLAPDEPSDPFTAHR